MPLKPRSSNADLAALTPEVPQEWTLATKMVRCRGLVGLTGVKSVGQPFNDQQILYRDLAPRPDPQNGHDHALPQGRRRDRRQGRL